MDLPDLAVHSINVQHTVAPDHTSTLAKAKRLTYHIGKHGPFEHVYHGDTGTVTQMKSDIGAQVAELQSLHQVEG
jgi:hypothetical protein